MNSNRTQDDEPIQDELLSAYLDNELSDADRDALKSKLEQDPELRESLAELERLSQMLQGAPRHTLPTQFADRVLRRAERQMLLGDGVPSHQVKDVSKLAAPARAASAKPPVIRRYWWIPATLAALLAGVLFIPALVQPTDLAKVDQESKALKGAAKDPAVADQIARSTEKEATDETFFRPDGPSAPARAAEPMSRASATPETTAAGQENRSFRDSVAANEIAADAEKMELSPAAAPALTLEEDLADDQPAAVETVGRARMQRGGLAREARLEELDEQWQYGPDARLIEVEFPIVAGGRATAAAKADGDALEGVTDGAAVGGSKIVANAGQLYRIAGPPAELGNLLARFKSDGAIIYDHELPLELREQLASQKPQRWLKRSETSRSNATADDRSAGGLGKFESRTIRPDVDTLGEIESLRAYVESPQLQVAILDPTNSEVLAQLAARSMRGVARKKQQPPQLQKTLAEGENAERPWEEKTAPAGQTALPPDVRQRLEQQMARSLSGDAESRAAEDKVPSQRAELYLWFRQRPRPVAIPADDEQPARDNRN